VAEKLREIREAKRVVLVRHGQSTWNEEGRIQGSSDYSVLTSKGESQAETSRQMLLSDSFDACFTRSFPNSSYLLWNAIRFYVVDQKVKM
jgi:2-carboxy-D-arabinitol-1-phosphatase